MKRKTEFTRVVISLVCSLVVLFCPSMAVAQSSSTNYMVNEYFFGSGGELEVCSVGYCAKLSAGETAVGTVESTNFKAFAGFNTTDKPYIEMDITASTIDLGILDAATAKTGSGTMSIRTYLASGYVVTSMGPTLTSEGGATITAMAAQAASSVGTEQFGMNLVANTSPATFGANPVQYPDATFSFGQVDGDYDNTNQYRYVPGDQIAFSNESTGITTYTVSYIANIAPLTESGLYRSDQVFVATSTY